MRLPSLKYLRTFQIAGRHLSFKIAADQLSITPSAVSHQVRNLESYLGFALFSRKTRALELTDAGRRYFEFLDAMFTRLESETEQLCNQYHRSVVRICVPPFFASEALLPRLASFGSASRETDIRVSTQPSATKAHPSEADVSVLLGTGNWPALRTYPLMARRVVVACAPALLAKEKLRSYDSLNGQTLIVHENRLNSWAQWATGVGIPQPEPSKLLHFDSMAAVVRAAERGLGVALVSWPLARAWFDSGALARVFEDEIETGECFYLAHRPEDADRPEVRRLIDWLIHEFHESV